MYIYIYVRCNYHGINNSNAISLRICHLWSAIAPSCPHPTYRTSVRDGGDGQRSQLLPGAADKRWRWIYIQFTTPTIQKWVHLPWIFLGNSGFRNPVDYLEKRGCHAKKCYSTKKHSPSLRINHKLIYIPWVLISFMFHLWYVYSSLYTVYVYI